ncbi:N-acetyltransferase [Paenibacillus sp. GYB003]|uniref:N-acetyltransferase n=1 Tax=Paenibacillus sp. GYB003 TaxID=2994392 RepID=UPI002F96C935
MNIRKFRESDIDALIHIWLSGSSGSHSFIDASYWHSKKEAMATTYLPASNTYVLEEDGEPLGFISMVDTYLAALFVDPARQSSGCGTQLLNHVKSECEQIHLNVYQKNTRAVQFYLHNGFTIERSGRDDETGEDEYRMTWEKQRESS